MSLRYEFDDRMPKDDGFNLQNCGYAILLVVSYITLALVLGAAMLQ
jgi:hypothetical protein